MALKVVPAGDERCDIHNGRRPPAFVCETCLQEFGIDPTQPTVGGRRRRSRLPRPIRRALRRWRSPGNRRVRIGVGAGGLIAVVVVIVLVLSGGGGKNTSPTQADVVDALELIPKSTGSGWTTSDGTCTVAAIVTGAEVRPGNVAGNLAVEVTNEDQTVGAVVTPNVSSFIPATVADCVDQVGAELRSQF